MRPRLRPARELDSELVLSWANDPVTRAMSFNTRPIDPVEHRTWFERSLAEGARRLFIAEDEQGPLGLARLDLCGEPACAEVGISLAPERRGQGHSVRVLEALIGEARRSGLRRLLARIRQENEPSQRAFTRAGFVPIGSEPVDDVRALCYELRLDDADDA